MNLPKTKHSKYTAVQGQVGDLGFHIVVLMNENRTGRFGFGYKIQFIEKFG